MIKPALSLQIPRIIFFFVLIKSLLHLYTISFAGYGIFRDELYLYACSLRLDAGYIDQPPLSVWFLKLITVIFGKSLFSMRFFAALFGALTLIPLGLTVKELGGKRLAISIASMAYIISPIYLAYSSYYSMNSIDLLLWHCIIYLLIRQKTTQNPKTWILLGLLMGMALLNKIGMLWFGLGLLIALMVTGERHWLGGRWPYIAGFLALLIFIPYIWWNMQHDWATIEFLGSTSEKYSSENIGTFFTGQLLIQNPSNVVVWLAGFGFYMFIDKKHQGLTLFIIFLTILAILLINVHSKPEYLAPIFTVLFIGGGIAIESWTRKRKWIAYLVIGNQVIGILSAPFSLPILPVKTYLSYADFVGLAPKTSEGHQLSELPQFYADMFGWENQAKKVAEVYHALSDEDKKICAIFGDNYGRSGAIDYFSDQYDLPLSIGRHNNYWIWGPGSYNGELLLVCSNDLGDKQELFEEVTEMGTIYTKYAIPYENNLKIYLCRNIKYPIEQLWPTLKTFN
jgi:hypothetical protein